MNLWFGGSGDIVEDQLFGVGAPSWSSDGDRIVFTCSSTEPELYGDEKLGEAICSMNVDGSGRKILTPASGMVCDERESTSSGLIKCYPKQNTEPMYTFLHYRPMWMPR